MNEWQDIRYTNEIESFEVLVCINLSYVLDFPA
jgi:hypothetical protein